MKRIYLAVVALSMLGLCVESSPIRAEPALASPFPPTASYWPRATTWSATAASIGAPSQCGTLPRASGGARS